MEELAYRPYFLERSAVWEPEEERIVLDLVVEGIDASRAEEEVNDDVSDCITASFPEPAGDWDFEVLGVEVLGAV